MLYYVIIPFINLGEETICIVRFMQNCFLKKYVLKADVEK